MIGELLRSTARREVTRRNYFAIVQITAVAWRTQLARGVVLTSGMRTNWLRLGAGFASSGDGSLRPVRAGDEVLACFLDGNPAGQGVVLCPLYGAATPPALGENVMGAQQGQGKVIFDAQGRVALDVPALDVRATGEASINGSQVKLGDATASAMMFEQYDMGIQAWAAVVAAVLAGLGITIGLPQTSAGKAMKVKVS